MMISWVAFFWLAANCLTAGLAWAIIPSNMGFHNDDGFSYESWRIFVAFCTIPAATSVVTFLFLPESPKFLLEVSFLAVSLNPNPKYVTVSKYKVQKCPGVSLGLDRND